MLHGSLKLMNIIKVSVIESGLITPIACLLKHSFCFIKLTPSSYIPDRVNVFQIFIPAEMHNIPRFNYFVIVPMQNHRMIKCKQRIWVILVALNQCVGALIIIYTKIKYHRRCWLFHSG